MQIGIRLHDTAPGTLSERLGYARAQGFTCAHLALGKAVDGFVTAEAPRLLTDEFAREVRSDFEENGMECAVLGCYLNLADPDPESRAETQRIYRAHLRFAGRIGAKTVGTETYAHPKAAYPVPPGESEDAYRLFLDALRPVVRYAEETGTVISVEPVYSHIISTPERAERMLNDVSGDHLGIILDTVNLIGPEQIGHEDAVIEDALSRLGGRITVLHMKDYTVQNGMPVSGACGTGRMRYDRLIAYAKKYGLPMTLEDTAPENAEQARFYLERAGREAEA